MGARFLLLSVLLSFSASSLRVAIADETVRATIEHVHKEGQAIGLRWSDGREAELFIARRAPVIIPLDFEVTENTCTDRVSLSCQFGIAFKANSLDLRWKSHPDASKIGKTVILKISVGKGQTFDLPLNQLAIYEASAKRFQPKIGADLPKDEITCADYSWLPGGGPGAAPESVLLQRLDGELMLPNPETGLVENRILSGALDVSLVRSPKGNLQIDKVREYTGSPLGSVVGFVGDILAAILKNGEGEFCQISLKPNLAAVGDALGKYLASQPPHFEPCIYGVDEYSQYQGGSLTETYLRNLSLLEKTDVQ